MKKSLRIFCLTFLGVLFSLLGVMGIKENNSELLRSSIEIFVIFVGFATSDNHLQH